MVWWADWPTALALKQNSVGIRRRILLRIGPSLLVILSSESDFLKVIITSLTCIGGMGYLSYMRELIFFSKDYNYCVGDYFLNGSIKNFKGISASWLTYQIWSHNKLFKIIFKKENVSLCENKCRYFIFNLRLWWF